MDLIIEMLALPTHLVLTECCIFVTQICQMLFEIGGWLNPTAQSKTQPNESGVHFIS